jgi:hypothetical protein
MGYKEDQRAISTGVTDGTIKLRDAFPKDYVMPAHRNDVLEEVALEIEKMVRDTPASFAAYVRGMKR